ncbi:hypothetical protein GWI33_011174 [Rhynchophorus ferrugineus]|uniref:Uncharacterized protein n=1 Tax=Rhynchophorus ferrugineus TaxID=354439 RepID=A0A834I7G3_RHYFE|nr:hypothetical protein GWI33_011174 [Rhynchophorus ferrugineus]
MFFLGENVCKDRENKTKEKQDPVVIYWRGWERSEWLLRPRKIQDHSEGKRGPVYGTRSKNNYTSIRPPPPRSGGGAADAVDRPLTLPRGPIKEWIHSFAARNDKKP